MPGIQGPKGETGLQGQRGETGLNGKDGRDGRDGRDAESIESISIDSNGDLIVEFQHGTIRNLGKVKGSPGQNGLDGLDGTPGETGLQGLRGEQGPKGDTGSQGLPGIDGLQGPQGEKGDTGETGPQGLPGQNADPETIVQNLLNDPNFIIRINNKLIDDYLPLIKGDQGDIGPQGIQGLPGPQGLRGETGLQGLQGIQGPKGDTGAQGQVGSQGLKGDQGIQGLQGPKGDTGSSPTIADILNAMANDPRFQNNNSQNMEPLGTYKVDNSGNIVGKLVSEYQIDLSLVQRNEREDFYINYGLILSPENIKERIDCKSYKIKTSTNNFITYDNCKDMQYNTSYSNSVSSIFQYYKPIMPLYIKRNSDTIYYRKDVNEPYNATYFVPCNIAGKIMQNGQWVNYANNSPLSLCSKSFYIKRYVNVDFLVPSRNGENLSLNHSTYGIGSIQKGLNVSNGFNSEQEIIASANSYYRVTNIVSVYTLQYDSSGRLISTTFLGTVFEREYLGDEIPSTEIINEN